MGACNVQPPLVTFDRPFFFLQTLLCRSKGIVEIATEWFINVDCFQRRIFPAPITSHRICGCATMNQQFLARTHTVNYEFLIKPAECRHLTSPRGWHVVFGHETVWAGVLFPLGSNPYLSKGVCQWECYCAMLVG